MSSPLTWVFKFEFLRFHLSLWCFSSVMYFHRFNNSCCYCYSSCILFVSLRFQFVCTTDFPFCSKWVSRSFRSERKFWKETKWDCFEVLIFLDCGWWFAVVFSYQGLVRNLFLWTRLGGGCKKPLSKISFNIYNVLPTRCPRVHNFLFF